MSATDPMHVSPNLPEVSGENIASQKVDSPSSKPYLISPASKQPSTGNPSSSKQQREVQQLANPASFSIRMTRKRAADLANLEESKKGVTQEQESSLHQEQRLSVTPALICLCPPDPKIPRPRNGRIFFHLIDELY